MKNKYPFSSTEVSKKIVSFLWLALFIFSVSFLIFSSSITQAKTSYWKTYFSETERKAVEKNAEKYTQKEIKEKSQGWKNLFSSFHIKNGSIEDQDIKSIGADKITGLAALDGSQITNLNPANITGGVLNLASGSLSVDNLSLNGNTFSATNNDGLSLTDNAGNGLTIADGGNVGIGTTSPGYTLDVNGHILFTKDLSPVGLDTTQIVDGYATNRANGGSVNSQWGSAIYRMYTVAGQTDIGQLNGILTAVYHDKGFTVPYWAGVETGAMFLDGATSIFSEGYGMLAAYPTLANGATVGKYAPIKIPWTNTTGVANWYSLLSESSYPAQFVGSAGINLTTTSGPYATFKTSTNTLVITGGTTGIILRDGGGSQNNLTAVSGTTRLSGLGYRGDATPSGLVNGALIFNATANYTGNARRWSIANNQSVAGSLEFYVSSSATTDPDITTPGTPVLALSRSGNMTITGNVGIGTTAPTAKLEVDGIIKTKERSTATCDANAKGGIYFDSDDNHFYGCNGSAWVQLDN